MTMSFGSSFHLGGIVISGLSLSMVILLSSLHKIAYESDNKVALNYSSTTVPTEGDATEMVTNPGTTGKFTKQECRKFLLYFAKKMMRILKGCMQELKAQTPDTDEYGKKFSCALRCLLKSTRLLNENFKMTNETMYSFAEEWVPEKYRSIAWHFGTPCLDVWVDKLDATDPYCKTYGELVGCVQNGIADCR